MFKDTHRLLFNVRMFYINRYRGIMAFHNRAWYELIPPAVFPYVVPMSQGQALANALGSIHPARRVW